LPFSHAAAIGSAAYAWQQLKTNEAFLYATLKTATSFVDDAVTQAEKYGVPRTDTLSLLTRAEGLFDNMAMLGKPTPELRYQKAWMLIQFARNYQALGDTTKWQERAVAAQQLFQTLSDGDPPRAMPAGSAISPWPTTSWVMLLRRKVSPMMHLSPTSRAVRSWNASPRRTRAILPGSAKSRSPTLRLGMWCSPKGDADKALESFRQALAIREGLAKSDPNNADWQRDLAIAHGRVGIALAQRGKMDDAFVELHKGRALVAELKDKSSASAALAQDLVWFDKTLAGLKDVVAPAPQESEAKPELH
jgi:tetratricopeptide (TPR) repeat protein